MRLFLVVTIFFGLQAQTLSTVAQGQKLIAQGEWKAAKAVFEEILQSKPNDLGARIGLGIALWGAGDRAGATDAFRKAVESNPRSAQAHYNVALALRDTGQTAEAIAEMKRALALRPSYDEAELALGLMIQGSGDVKAAMVHYRAVLKRSPKSAEAHNWLGVAYMATNELAAAADEFRKAIELKPDYARAYNNLGTTLAQAGDVTEGIEVLRAGLKHAPQDLQINLNLGTALRTTGDADGALELFQVVLKASPDDPEIHQQIGLTFRQKGEFEEAIAAFENSVRLNPEYQDGYYALAQTLRQVSASKKNRSGDTNDAKAQLVRGLEQVRTQNLPAAIESFRISIKLDPNLADAHYSLGAALWYRGSKQEAIAELDAAIELNPAAADPYVLRAVAYRDAGDLVSALRISQRTIALNPNAPVGYFDAALILLRMNQADRAIGLFEAGLNLPSNATRPPDLEVAIREMQAYLAKNDSAEGCNVLGRMMGLAGADAKAVLDQFAAAIKLRPEFAEAHNNQGLVYTQLNEDDKAITAFREAIRLRPDYADAHSNLGAILTSSDSKTAVLELEKAVALQPGLLKAQFNLSLAYAAHPDHGITKQIEVLRKLIGVNPDYPRADFVLGKALLQKGELDEAVKHLQKASAMEPKFGEAQYQLGLALSRLGKREEAAVALTKGRELVVASQREQTRVLDLREGKLGQTDDQTSRSQFEKYIREGRFAEAQPLLEAFTNDHPKSAWGWYALGYIYFAQQKVGDSVKALAKSLSLDVTNADAHKTLGRNLMIIGRFDEARIEFQQGEKYDPKSAEMPYNLGKLYSIQDQWPQAKAAFERALNLDAAYMEAHDGLGFALEALGDDAAAIKSYQRAAQFNDERHAGFGAPYVNLSALCNRTGDAPNALAYARKAIEVNPKGDRGWFQLAKALERSGEMDPAIDALKRAIDLNGRVSTYHYVLGTLYRRAGRPGESRAAMEQFAKLDRETSELEKKRQNALRQGADRE